MIGAVSDFLTLKFPNTITDSCCQSNLLREEQFHTGS